jgi:drug/metabolite transporter (DMT)-like permease
LASKANSSKLRNRLLLFAAAFLFSTGGAAIKACSLSSWQIAGFRSGIAAVALWIFLPEARRCWTWRNFFIGSAYAATLIFFVLANRLTTSANTIFLQSTAPLYLLLLGPLVLREPIRRIDIAVISAVAAGALLLLFGSPGMVRTAPDPARGNIFGLASGVTWAITLTGLRWLGKRTRYAESAAGTVIVGNCIAFVFCLPHAWPVVHSTTADWIILLYLGVFQVGLAYLALTRSIRHVPGLEAATLLLVEPVFNPVWTWLIQGEQPGALALAGGGIIIAATLAGTWQQTRAARMQSAGHSAG